MINIVLFGPPGAGKGTQSEKLISKYGFVHLSTGDIFRRNIKEATELGQLAKSYMDQGQLVPDSVTISMLQAEVVKSTGAKGFIFDGFPRNANQANALDAFLKGNGTSITKMIALEVPEEELRKRLLERGKTSGRPDDVDPLVIQKRIDVYNSETAPVKDYYQAQGKYAGVNGVGSIESIFGLICGVIDSVSTAKVAPAPKKENVAPSVKTIKTAAPKAPTKTTKVKTVAKKEKKAIKKVVVKKTKTVKKKAAKKTVKKSASTKPSTGKKKKTGKRGRPTAPKRRGRPQIKKRGRPTSPKRRGRPQIKKRGRPTLPKKRGRPQIKKRGRPTLPKKRGRPQIKKRGRPTLPKPKGRPQLKKRGRPTVKKTTSKKTSKKVISKKPVKKQVTKKKQVKKSVSKKIKTRRK